MNPILIKPSWCLIATDIGAEVPWRCNSHPPAYLALPCAFASRMAGEEYDKDLDAHGFRGKLREKAKAAAAAASKSAKKVCPQTRPLLSSSSSLRSPAHGSIKRDSEREKNRNVIESEIKRVGSLRERERERVCVYFYTRLCVCVCVCPVPQIALRRCSSACY